MTNETSRPEGPLTAPTSSRHSEAGDTLIEVLIAVVLLGITAVALLTAFATSITASGQHRSLVTFDTVLRSASSEAISQLQQQSSSLWNTCGGAGPSGSAGTVNFSLPTNYAAQVTAVQYWNGTTFNPAATWNSVTSAYTPCLANAPQYVTLTITSGSTSRIVSFVVENRLTRPIPTAGPATQLAFVVQPGGAASATALSPQPEVAVEDALGNVVTSNLSPVTVTITSGSGTSGATLGNTCSGSEYFGVVYFSNCSIVRAGANFTLTATDGSLASTTSATFTITPGPPAQLVVTTQPGNGTGGLPLSVQPAVSVEDAGGNTVTIDSSQVTLSITPGTGSSGASLSCPANPVSASSGIAQFAGCSITLAGIGYTVTASDGALTSAISNTFNVTVGPAAQVTFTTQPGNGVAGSALIPQPIVAVQDAGGNTVTSNSSPVVLSIGSNPGASSLTCSPTNTVNTVGGVATFVGCALNKVATGYTLVANDGSLTSETSAPFNITPGPASKFVLTSASVSGTAAANATLGPITVQEQDASGNPTTTAETVTLGSSSSGTRSFSATSGGSTVTSVAIPSGSSSATFYYGDTKAGTPTITVSGTLTPGTQVETVTAGVSAQLAFSPLSPGPGVAGSAIPNLATQVQDAFGNPVTVSGGTVVLTVKSGSPQSGFTSGSASAPVSGGVATFANLVVNASGNYTLTATPSSISGVSSPANSSAFTVAPAAAASFSLVNIGTQTAGVAFSDAITALDAYGNTATGYAGAKTLVFSGPSNSPNATAPTYPVSVTFTAGIGTASGITLVDAQGTLLTATQGTISGSSNGFTVAAGAATSFNLANLGTQTAGNAFADTVTALDTYANTATSYTGAKALVFTGPSNSPNATAPTYPASVTFTAGIGTASAITLVDAQSTILTATLGSLTDSTSAFTVASAALSAFTVPTPTTQTAGSAFNETITAVDAYRNVASGWTSVTSCVAFSGLTGSPVYPAAGACGAGKSSLTFNASGQATASITPVDAETTSLMVTSVSTPTGMTGTSGLFTVNAVLTVSPASGTVGTTGVTLNGTGYTVGTTVSATFGGSALTLSPAAPVVAANGTWSATFTVPASSNGAKTVTATDPGGTSSSSTFTVTPVLAVSPSSGTVGATGITLSGTGYFAGKTVSATFGGSALALTPAAPTVSASGTWSATFTVPNSSHSAKTITAIDSGGASASSTFTVNAALTVSPSTSTVGTSGVTLSGTGYTASATVNISTGVTLGGSALTISATQTVSASGTWSATFTVPSSTNGAKTITATDSGGASGSSTFTVAANLAVSPSGGKAGTTGITLSGTGYTAAATVNASTGVTFAGSALTISATQTVSASGSWTATFTVPSGTGVKTIVATDSSGANDSTTFTIFSFGAAELNNNGTTPCGGNMFSHVCTGPNVTTTSGSTELILVFLTGSGESGSTVSSISGPLTGTAQLTSTVVGNTFEHSFEYAWTATGTGGTGNVSVTFDSGMSHATGVVIDVVELAPGNSVVTSGVRSGTSKSPLFAMTIANASDSEVDFMAYDVNESNTLTGFTSLASGTNSAGDFGWDTYSRLVDTASATGSLVTSAPWGTIAIEINP